MITQAFALKSLIMWGLVIGAFTFHAIGLFW